VDVRGRARGVTAATDRQEADRLRRRHDHPHPRGQLLDPLVVAERRDAFAQRRVSGRQRRVELERAPHARSQLQHLDLHRDDSGEHHAEQRDPCPPADQPIEQAMVWKRADERGGASADRVAASRARCRTGQRL
jgi:hypothetical protein